MTPLERATRALFEEAQKQGPVPPFGYADADDGRTILDGAYDLKAMVRAVLTAIREPSEEMGFAGSEVPVDTGHGFDTRAMPSANRLIWQGMIDAMLAETPQPT